MPNLRALADRDFRHAVLADAQPVTAITPDGARITLTTDGRPLKGLVRMTQTQLTDEGVAVITPNPTLKLCRADLNRIPKTGEKWAFDICAGPTDTTPTMCLLMDTGQAVTGGKTIGWVDIPLVAPQGDGNA